MASIELNDILLILLMVLVFTICIGALRRIRTFISMRGAALLALTGVLLGIYIWVNRHEVRPSDWAQLLLVVGLVLVTTVYATSASQQAEASVKMAEEMREQRITTSRPIILQEAIPFRGDNLYDYFKIYNVGNGPAIELEIVLLGKDKQLLARETKTAFMINTETKFDIKAVGLSNHFDSLCQLLCQYRSIESNKLWYKTILPFIPRESKRNGIIIVPQELEFYESPEKELF